MFNYEPCQYFRIMSIQPYYFNSLRYHITWTHQPSFFALANPTYFHNQFFLQNNWLNGINSPLENEQDQIFRKLESTIETFRNGKYTQMSTIASMLGILKDNSIISISQIQKEVTFDSYLTEISYIYSTLKEPNRNNTVQTGLPLPSINFNKTNIKSNCYIFTILYFYSTLFPLQLLNSLGPRTHGYTRSLYLDSFLYLWLIVSIINIWLISIMTHILAI